MSAAGVWNVRPIVVFGLFMWGSQWPGLRDIDILCKIMAAEAHIINMSMLMPFFSATQEETDPFYLISNVMLMLYGCCR